MKKRVLLLSLMSILLLLSVPFIGCDSEESLAAEEIAEVVESVGTNGQSACTFDIDMSAKVKVDANGQSLEATVEGGGEGAIDIENKKMHLPLTIAANIPFTGPQTLGMEMYIDGGWMYMNMDGEWTKMELPQDVLGEQDQSLLIGQLTGLMALLEIEHNGYGDVNDVRCYKFQINPDLGELTGYALEQFPQSEIGDYELDVMGQVEDIMSSFDVECTFWISTEEGNNRLMKIELILDGDLSSNDIPEMAESGFNSMSLNMNMVIVFDYNESVNIVVPNEALNAYDQGSYEW